MVGITSGTYIDRLQDKLKYIPSLSDKLEKGLRVVWVWNWLIIFVAPFRGAPNDHISGLIFVEIFNIITVIDT